jgi:hypothetical protein
MIISLKYAILISQFTSEVISMFKGVDHLREYSAWRHMKGRCYCTSDKKYPSYGGRGIRVCDEWVNDFSQFYIDMGDKPEGSLSIERIDNDGNYTPENCCWATARQQANNRRSSRLLTYKGKTKTAEQWSRELGIKSFTLRARLDVAGMSVEQAFETPVITRKRKKYTHNGITDTVTGWSLRLGFGRNTISERMRRGMSFKDAIKCQFTPHKLRRAGLVIP